VPPKSNETAHWRNSITGKLGARVPDNGVGLLPGQGGLRARRIGGQGEEPRLIFGAGLVLGKYQANFIHNFNRLQATSEVRVLFAAPTFLNAIKHFSVRSAGR
jgi:hypothetical protein